MGFRLEYLSLILAHSEGQDQGYAHFYNENLGNGVK